jgi:hypothetical protein
MDQIGPSGHQVTLVHFVHQVSPERIACMPNMTEFHSTPQHPAYMRTNVPVAVSCPQCKRTDLFKQALQRMG